MLPQQGDVSYFFPLCRCVRPGWCPVVTPRRCAQVATLTRQLAEATAQRDDAQAALAESQVTLRRSPTPPFELLNTAQFGHP